MQITAEAQENLERIVQRLYIQSNGALMLGRVEDCVRAVLEILPALDRAPEIREALFPIMLAYAVAADSVWSS